MSYPNPKPRIALIGECMIELQQRADGSLQQSFGGDTLNTAVYLSRALGDKGAVDYVTALGADSFSDAMCQSRSEEHTSELQSLMRISYAVFCLNKKIKSYIKTQLTYGVVID